MSNSKDNNGKWEKQIAQFNLGTASQLQIKLLKKDEHGSILFQLFRKPSDAFPDQKPADSIELPVALFPALKRSIAALEQALVSEHLDSDFKSEDEAGVAHNGDQILFAHESEREFAQILDFYQIEWLYEPCTFSIRWDEQGNVIESFTPDFYLPEQDQYIELTTLKQELVTKKNRKVRLLKELYPEINIKIMYGKDYRRLLEKYAGKIEKKEDGPK